MRTLQPMIWQLCHLCLLSDVKKAFPARQRLRKKDNRKQVLRAECLYISSIPRRSTRQNFRSILSPSTPVGLSRPVFKRRLIGRPAVEQNTLIEYISSTEVEVDRAAVAYMTELIDLPTFDDNSQQAQTRITRSSGDMHLHIRGVGLYRCLGAASEERQYSV